MRHKLLTFLTLPILAIFVPISAERIRSEAPCINIFYDRGPPGYWIGRTYATFLQNLLGHFPKYQQIVSPIEFYRAGDIENCHATFYIGSYFENPIPAEFFSDYKKTSKPVAWLGYSFWRLGEDLENIFGFRYEHLTKLDLEHRDNKGLPSFFRYIDYKGETFFKFAEWSRDGSGKFLAGFEQVRMKESQPGKSEVLAWARHSATNEKIPYVIRTGKRFYMADVPFSFMHEGDRYLVFADLLFDILGEEPRNKEKLAMVRVEDVHPMIPLQNFYGITKVLLEEKIPFGISLIPIFFDPLKRFDRIHEEEYMPMHRKREFLQLLRELPPDQVTFIWHGVTHQYGRLKNTFGGLTGSDFEFWNAIANKPIAEDSASWTMKRLHQGIEVIERAGFKVPPVWLTPHYQASALDYLLFARLFPWNIGRVIYMDYEVQGLPLQSQENEFWIRSADDGEQEKRLAAFKNLKVNLPSARWNGQFFPYEIYGDVYGQRLLPEDLGASQPYISEMVIRTRSLQDLLGDAKRNRVLRDAWASFFYHPHLLESYNNGGRGAYPGDPRELRLLVQGIKQFGYKFVHIQEFTEKNLVPIRPEPIYREAR